MRPREQYTYTYRIIGAFRYATLRLMDEPGWKATVRDLHDSARRGLTLSPEGDQMWRTLDRYVRHVGPARLTDTDAITLAKAVVGDTPAVRAAITSAHNARFTRFTGRVWSAAKRDYQQRAVKRRVQQRARQLKIQAKEAV